MSLNDAFVFSSFEMNDKDRREKEHTAAHKIKIYLWNQSAHIVSGFILVINYCG